MSFPCSWAVKALMTLVSAIQNVCAVSSKRKKETLVQITICTSVFCQLAAILLCFASRFLAPHILCGTAASDTDWR